jgi:hypothetical protein
VCVCVNFPVAVSESVMLPGCSKGIETYSCWVKAAHASQCPCISLDS